MKRTLATLLLAMALPHGLPAWAGTDGMNMNGGGSAGHAAMAEMMSDGTVKKVDKAQGKLTIRHGPLANLDMPAMTMVFRVQDPALMGRVKPGDKIRFRAERMNGALTVTQIEMPR